MLVEILVMVSGLGISYRWPQTSAESENVFYVIFDPRFLMMPALI